MNHRGNNNITPFPPRHSKDQSIRKGRWKKTSLALGFGNGDFSEPAPLECDLLPLSSDLDLFPDLIPSPKYSRKKEDILYSSSSSLPGKWEGIQHYSFLTSPLKDISFKKKTWFHTLILYAEIRFFLKKIKKLLVAARACLIDGRPMSPLLFIANNSSKERGGGGGTNKCLKRVDK